MKKPILILSNSLGGLYSFRKEVIQTLCEKNFSVCICVPQTDRSSSFFESIGCTLTTIAFNRRGMNPFADIKLLLAYKRLIVKQKPIVVLSYTIKPNVYGGMACRIAKTPQIVNVTGLGDAVENGGWLQKLTILLYKIGTGKAKQVFFQNKTNRDICISYGIADESSIVLPGSGVNLHYHTYQDYPSDGVIYFMFIARLLKDKGTDEFFEMASFIKSKYPETGFLILGAVEGNYQSKLNELESKGVVHHLGTTADVRPYLAKVHCTIMPSYHEGMSNVNLESAANGRPVITTNVPGCRETVDDGVTGIIVEPKNTLSLIDGVERFLALTYDQKKQMGINGRRKVENEFDRQIVVREYLKAIENV